MLRSIFLIFLLAIQGVAISQIVLQGSITDAQSGQALSGAHLVLKGQPKGVLSDAKGRFSIHIESFPATMRCSLLGYETIETVIQASISGEPLSIRLEPVIIQLDEVNILSGQAVARHNPIAFQTVFQQKIAAELGDKPLPEVFNFSPGLFSHREGGGSGDASLRIRGFEQENIAVLLDGVPINGAENGLVYWNNWMGLAEVASSIQIQRGIGASKVALNSVGGTVNIVTLGNNEEQRAVLNLQTTDYGNNRMSLGYHSGRNENGWAYSFLASRTKGQGYIPGTFVDGWAYFAAISKEISTQQRIVFTTLGGPEKHGQRNIMLTQNEVNRYGYDYNKEWGGWNGTMRNSSQNFYHKPHLALNHYLQFGKQSLLATSAYFSPGTGGGKWSDSFDPNVNLYSFRTASGQIDWDAIYRYNQSNTDTLTLDDGRKLSGFSKVVQTDFLASHLWAGLISNLEIRLAPHTKWINGVHYRYFSSDLRQEVADLLGGDSYVDDYAWSLAGRAGREPVKKTGDIIRLHNGALTHQATIFSQIEYQKGRWLFFASANFSGNTYKRHDEYNYPLNKWSPTVRRSGFDFKTGLGFSLTESQHLYLNAATFSKAPYYKFVFGNFNNTPTLNLQNEKVRTAEAGYSLTHNKLSLNLSAYYTLWQDVAFLSYEYIQLENNTQSRAMVSGLNSKHLGFETELAYQPAEQIRIRAIASFGDWRWQNDVSAVLFNDLNVAVDTVKVYAKGLFVGGQPQTQLGLALEFKPWREMAIQIETIHYRRQFARFDPAGRQDVADREQSFRLPQVTATHLSFQIPMVISKNRLCFYGRFNNIFNTRYILNGEDGSNHQLDTFRGFWSFGRTFDAGLRFEFN